MPEGTGVQIPPPPPPTSEGLRGGHERERSSYGWRKPKLVGRAVTTPCLRLGSSRCRHRSEWPRARSLPCSRVTTRRRDRNGASPPPACARSSARRVGSWQGATRSRAPGLEGTGERSETRGGSTTPGPPASRPGFARSRRRGRDRRGARRSAMGSSPKTSLMLHRSDAPGATRAPPGHSPDAAPGKTERHRDSTRCQPSPCDDARCETRFAIPEGLMIDRIPSGTGQLGSRSRSRGASGSPVPHEIRSIMSRRGGTSQGRRPKAPRVIGTHRPPGRSALAWVAPLPARPPDLGRAARPRRRGSVR